MNEKNVLKSTTTHLPTSRTTTTSATHRTGRRQRSSRKESRQHDFRSAHMGPGQIRKITVSGARLVQSRDSQYFVFKIITLTSNALQRFETERRFSHFVVLHEELQKGGVRSLPGLPPKKFFRSMSRAFVERRRVALEKYLTELINHPDVGGASGIGNVTFQYFLNLNLGTDPRSGMSGFGWATRTTSALRFGKDVEVGGTGLTPLKFLGCC